MRLIKQFIVCVLLILFCGCTNGNPSKDDTVNSSKSSIASVTPAVDAATTTLEDNSFEKPSDIEPDRIKTFLSDAGLPDEIYEEFLEAIQGDQTAQNWLEKYEDDHFDKSWTALDEVFPYGNIQEAYLASDCNYNIGMLYYDGEDDLKIEEDKEKAFYWLNSAAKTGSFWGAIEAGEMARTGNGIIKDEKKAFELYNLALENELNGVAYERLAFCYENGIGTIVDEDKALDNYFSSILDGYPRGLYVLSKSDKITQTQSILFSKAASSMDYMGDYFEMTYGGLDGYTADASKIEVVQKLSSLWDQEIDSIEIELPNTQTESKYFPEEFVNELLKASYTYSYHLFASKYGINPNCDYDDASTIEFLLTDDEDESYLIFKANQYLEYEDCEFYEVDFDGDGENEIGIPINSGAGGAFAIDGLCVFKKNEDGVYKEYSWGPDCTFRDAMRLIKYDNRVYFISNPFDDTNNAPHNIMAYTIDETGQGHEIMLECTDYKPKELMTKVYDNHNIYDFDGFITEIKKEAIEAISKTKNQEMFNPNQFKEVKMTEDISGDSSIEDYTDIYFEADINNDGVKEFIRKGHMVPQYNDCNLFHIYSNESDLLDNPEQMLDILPNDDFYGLHSGGNIYDYLPIAGNVVQFWTKNINDEVYCVALTRNELLYSLQIFVIENNAAIPVSKSVFFDEVQKIEVEYIQE